MWGCFTAGGTGAFRKVDGMIKKQYYVEKIKQHLKTSSCSLGANGSSKWTMTLSILLNQLQSGLKMTKSMLWSGTWEQGSIQT